MIGGGELAYFSYEFVRKVDETYIEATIDKEDYFYIIGSGEVLDYKLLEQLLCDKIFNRYTRFNITLYLL
jgi:hypothetical protein